MTDGITVLGPVAYREFALARACEENQGHTHNYDHVTVVMTGAVKVFYRLPGDTEGRESKEFHAGTHNCMFLVKAGVEHRIKAMFPGTSYRCVFSHRDFDGQVIQEYEGNEAAYV